MDLSDYEIINEPDMIEASLKAVKLAHDGRADMYMKGLIDSKNFLKSVLNKEVGLVPVEPCLMYVYLRFPALTDFCS